jgi:hypothetical protein
MTIREVADLRTVESIPVTTRIVGAEVREEHREALLAQAKAFGGILRTIDPAAADASARVEMFATIGESLLADRDAAIAVVRERLDKALKGGVFDASSPVRVSLLSARSSMAALTLSVFGSVEGAKKVLGVPVGRRISTYQKMFTRFLRDLKGMADPVGWSLNALDNAIDLIELERQTVWVTIEKFAQLDFLFDLLFVDLDAAKRNDLTDEAAAFVDREIAPVIADRHVQLGDARRDVAQAYACLDLLIVAVDGLRTPLRTVQDSVVRLASARPTTWVAMNATERQATIAELDEALHDGIARIDVLIAYSSEANARIVESLKNLTPGAATA